MCARDLFRKCRRTGEAEVKRQDPGNPGEKGRPRSNGQIRAAPAKREGWRIELRSPKKKMTVTKIKVPPTHRPAERVGRAGRRINSCVSVRVRCGNLCGL